MRLVKFISPVLVLAVIVTLPVLPARADLPTATPLVNSTGTLTVKVVDAQGAAVANARVALILPRRHQKDGNSATGNRPKPNVVAKGVTRADGTFAFTNIPDGTYVAIAGLRGKGIGHERVTVTQTPSEITLTLTPHERKK
jgi:uncharacterized GH25 family protein